MMKMNSPRYLVAAAALAACATAWGQSERPAHSSMWLRAVEGTSVPFRYDGEGQEFVCHWGMDTAWDNTGNQTRGTNWIGRDVMGVGRLSYNPCDPINSDGTLTSAQKTQLDTRIAHLKATGTTNAILNCATDDQPTMEQNYTAQGPEAWFGIIKASVLYAQQKGITMVGIIPFNESDYSGWGQGSQADLKEIARLISEDDEIGSIPVCTGATLNCDYASSWYNCAKPYVSMGATHQLAGDFDHYADFFTEVVGDGHVGVMDEMHNVMEAMVGVNYGATYGIWWGYEAMARGYFCRANQPGGQRLGYAENRSAWGAASVYRLPDGQVDAFLGVSERQASDCDWVFTSLDRDVYYDGYGPVRSFFMHMPGGTGYQTDDQRNAERMIRVTAGADVQPFELGLDTVVIMNRNSRFVLTPSAGNSMTSGTDIRQNLYKQTNTYQQWVLTPTSDRIGGEFGFFTLRNLRNTNMALNLLNYSEQAGGTYIVYPNDSAANELFTFEYAGDGDFYIINKHSGLYLDVRNSSKMGGAVVQQSAFSGADSQRWRILQPEATCELVAPEAPQGLVATPQLASVRLDWQPNTTDTDLSAYLVLRGRVVSADSTQWDVIGRGVEGTSFVDNTCDPSVSYIYKVRAIDQACNLSLCSDSVVCQTTGERGLVAQWQLDGTTLDASSNLMDAALAGTANYNSLAKRSGSKSLTLDGSTNYLLLPHEAANQSELTVCAWVFASDRTSTWQRIFDFGNGTSQYLFLTPYSGSDMRLVAKNGGDEQILSASRLASGWHHVAATLGPDSVTLYVDGETVASSTELTIRPADFHPVLCYIGRSQFDADPLLKGRIDDVRIYSYALSADEVKAVTEDTADAIHGVSSDAAAQTDGPIYDLSGRRLPDVPAHGLYIQNGKKHWAH